MHERLGMQHSHFPSINPADLVAVTGGQTAPNSESTTVTLPVPGTEPVIDKRGTRSDYGFCLDTAKQMGLGVDDMIKLCGQPPAPAATP